MSTTSEGRLRETYADLLEAGDDPALLRLIGDLDTGYAAPPPPGMRGAAIRPLPGLPRVRTTTRRKTGAIARFAWLPAPLLLFLVVVFAAVASSPPGNIADLGKPTNAAPSFLPLGSFRNIHTVLHLGKKPEVLFLGTDADLSSAAERWPVVKALDQFGSWTGLRSTVPHHCYFKNGQPQVVCDQSPYVHQDLTGPTFDWSRARYSSRYVVLVQKDLIDSNKRVSNSLSPTELKLFNKYVRHSEFPGPGGWTQVVWHTAVDYPGMTEPGHEFPLVLIDGYLETGANVVNRGDFETVYSPPKYMGTLSFSQVEESLQRNQPLYGAPKTLIPDVNAEANVITALICHADGNRPSSACGRAVIRQTAKHIR